MKKYYTPDIEEFHVGFEYEFHGMTVGGFEIVDFRQDPPKTFKSKKPTDKIWSKEEIYKDTFEVYNRSFKTLEELIKSDQIRVKYLDREDIESLGFTLDKTSTETQWKFFKGNLCLYYRPETKELGTFTVDPNKNSFMNKYARDNKAISFLVIKNKSELKNLLKQLNIL